MDIKKYHKIREAVSNIVRKTLTEEYNKQIRNAREQRLTECVKRVVNETLKKYITEEGDKDVNRKRDYVLRILRGETGDKFNHAELARSLWHPSDKSEEDTYRSLFSKKVTGKPDRDGSIRSFDDSEINKLYELLRQN